MKISNFFRLNKPQAELDFVDVDVSRDTRLFVDPYAIEIRDDAFADELKRYIVSFFQTLLNATKSNDRAKLVSLTSHLGEPPDTFLGLSRGSPGRGVGRGQADQIIGALRGSRAVRTGQLSDLAEAELFIEGISSDKLSDLTTNVLRTPFYDYTRDQCELLGLATTKVAAPAAWNPGTLRWEAKYVDLPVVAGKRVLMIPKILVRRKLSLDSQEFYNAHMLEFLQAEELRAHGPLVRILKSKKAVVYKKDLKGKFPFSKSFLADFVAKHPDIIETYKKLKGAEGPLTSTELDSEFSEPLFAEALIQKLQSIPTGGDHASDYHSYMIGALTFIFFPYLTAPKKEVEIHQGRKRIDIRFFNSAKSGFFHRMRTWPQTGALYVFIECKNYGSEVGNPELDQLTSRFGRQRGRLGILTCRNVTDRNRLDAQCKDAAQDGRGLALVLTDADVVTLLQAIIDRRRSGIDRFLEQEAEKRLS